MKKVGTVSDVLCWASIGLIVAGVHTRRLKLPLAYSVMIDKKHEYAFRPAVERLLILRSWLDNFDFPLSWCILRRLGSVS
jgi:hypothetical protein